MNSRALTALALASLAGVAAAAPTVTFLPSGFLVTDLSFDGAIACGNVQGDFSYETFRWTAASGPVRLGRATVPVIGTGAGTPDISFDGKRISATIISSDVNATQGIWDATTNDWVETMPPMPADGANIDNSYGSAWGLSGDGTTLTGFYWRSPGTRGCTWSQSGGMVGLAQIGRSVRVNASNTNASVVVGWEDRPDGAWQPTAWRGGVRMRLVESDAPAAAEDVTGDGSFIVGDSYDPSIATRVATVWRWDGTQYVTDRIGVLPGTPLTIGFAGFDSVSNDGALAVGTNLYSFSPGGPRDGFVWTPAGGMVKDTDYVASLGLTAQFPAGADIVQLNAVSPDGSTIAGILLHPNFTYQTFLIRLRPLCPGDTNADSVVNFVDLNAVLSQYGQSGLMGSLAGDVNHDGAVDFADLNIVLGAFGTAC